MNNQRIAVYGGGGFAREVAWLISIHEKHGNFKCIGYIDDATDRELELNGKPTYSFELFVEQFPDALIAIGIGDPRTRRAVAENCAKVGFKFPVLWHQDVQKSEFIAAKQGAIICAGCILTVNIELDEHVHINLDCTIGHDVKIGAFTTLSPGVHVSGNVTIGTDVYVGTGATIINGEPDQPLIIGNGSVIAAGACVTKNTDPYSLYAGVPAKHKKSYA